ncbi:MAG: sulfatase-like hydrolase/transferase [Vicinamibacteria bacterium]
MARKRQKAHPPASLGQPASAAARPAGKPVAAARLVLGAIVIVVIVVASVWRSTSRRVKPDPLLSVVLITVDTLRADALGVYGGQAETPWIDRLAREGVRFETAHAHNVVTLPSHSNILSGQLALSHGVRDNTGFRFPTGMETVATRLKSLGFHTGAFVSAFVLNSRFGLDRGFDVYDDQATGIETQSPFKVPDRPGAVTVARAKAWIDAQGASQFFAWVHLYEPHSPYTAPEPFASRYAGHPYAAEVAAADAALGPLLESIMDVGRKQRVLVVFTSDHGEGLGEHQESTHGVFAYESTLRVPLILWSPILPAATVTTPVRHIDILPTILDALGRSRAAELPGRSLLPLAAAGEGAVTSSYFESLSASLNQGWAPLRGLFDGRFKYIDLPLPELYDLDKDPKELRNLVATEPIALDRLRTGLAREREKDRGSDRGQEDAATLEKLRALGYVAAGAAAPTKDQYTEADDPKNLIEIDERNRQVVTLFNQGGIHLGEAIDLVKRNLSERPDMSGANLQLAYLERTRGDLKAAVAAAKRAVKLKPLDGEAVALLGAYLTEMGEPQEAIRYLDPYAQAGAVNFDVLTALGLAQTALGRIDAARKAFLAAREIDPSNGLAIANLGVLELMAGNREAARTALEHAIELDPQIAKAHNTLGVMAAQEGRPAEAIERWKRSVEINENDYQTLFNLAGTLDQAGRRGEARGYFEAYLRVAPPALEARDIARVRAWLARPAR